MLFRCWLRMNLLVCRWSLGLLLVLKVGVVEGLEGESRESQLGAARAAVKCCTQI